VIPGLRRIIRTDDNVDEARFYPCNTVIQKQIAGQASRGIVGEITKRARAAQPINPRPAECV